jgi:hypothetical protein
VIVVVAAQHKKGKREMGFVFSIKTSSFGGLVILIQGFEICLRIYFL